MSWLTESSDAVRLKVHVAPGASRDEIAGMHGDALKVRLRAPAVDGRANRALVEFLAEALGAPKRDITLERGLRSREKQVRAAGISAARLRAALSALAGAELPS